MCITHSRGVRSISWAERRDVLPQPNIHLCCVWRRFKNRTPSAFQELTRVPASGALQVCERASILHEQQEEGSIFNHHQVRDGQF